MALIDSESLEDFLGEEVVNSLGTPIGTLACFWEHDEGKPILLGIDLGSTNDIHLAPAKEARFDTSKSCVVVEYSRDKVRKAPVLDCGLELDPKLEREVFAYYGDEELGYPESEIDSARELRRRNHEASKTES